MGISAVHAADRIKGLLEDLTDELITLGVGGYVKVGVRFVTGGTKAAASVKRAGDLWREIKNVYNEALNLVKTGTALAMEGWTNMPKDFKTISAKGYDHQGVNPPQPKPAVRPPVPAPAGGPTGLLGIVE